MGANCKTKQLQIDITVGTQRKSTSQHKENTTTFAFTRQRQTFSEVNQLLRRPNGQIVVVVFVGISQNEIISENSSLGEL